MPQKQKCTVQDARERVPRKSALPQKDEVELTGQKGKDGGWDLKRIASGRKRPRAERGYYIYEELQKSNMAQYSN